MTGTSGLRTTAHMLAIILVCSVRLAARHHEISTDGARTSVASEVGDSHVDAGVDAAIGSELRGPLGERLGEAQEFEPSDVQYGTSNAAASEE